MIIRDYFRLIRNIIIKYRVSEEDIYNFDKIGFQISIIITTKVIMGSEYSLRPIIIQLGNWE
jgi:hypothetical protein